MMKDYFNAETACQRANSANKNSQGNQIIDYDKKKEISEIFEGVEKAIKFGCFALRKEGIISEYTKGFLDGLGYEVEINWKYNYVVIRWKREGDKADKTYEE